MSHKSQHSPSISSTFTNAHSKRQLQAIIGKTVNKSKSNNELNQRQQLLAEKEAILKEKKKLNEIKRNKLRSKSNAVAPSHRDRDGHKNHHNKGYHNRNDKTLKEQQKISTEWMKI